MTTHYYLHNTLIALADIPEPNGPPHNFIYICSTCGECWGSIYTPGGCWIPQSVPCKQHSPLAVFDWNTIPGSLLQQNQRKEALSTMEWVLAVDLAPKPVLELFFLQLTKDLPDARLVSNS